MQLLCQLFDLVGRESQGHRLAVNYYAQKTDVGGGSNDLIVVNSEAEPPT